MRINRVLLRHGLDEIILATHLFRPLRFMRLVSPGYWLRGRLGDRGERIREALEELGPIFVKFGQILSTRRDLLPDDIADELAKLQDRVPPFHGGDARRIVEKAYGKPVEQIFKQFSEEPLASASIAQVHAAQLFDGSDVVVKVLRPDIEKTIRCDVALLYTIARLAQRYWSDGRRLRPVEVIEEFEKTIHDELDLVREAGNASQLRRNFTDIPDLYIPEVHWPLCKRNVMVMERVYGTPIGDMAALRAQGVDMKRLGELGVEVFFTQVFRHNFFHADMHPGNIFISDEGNYIAVDFGIVGVLSDVDQRYLAENFLAFFHRDYRRVAELHVESSWVPEGTRVEEFESAIRSVCEPIFERPIKEISFGHLLLRLFQTARRFDMEIQPQLVLLQKTLLNIEGLGRYLYPDLDLWQTAKPFLERWMSEQVGARAMFRHAKEKVPEWTEKLPELPGLMHDVLDKAASGRLQVEWNSSELSQLRRDLKVANRRTVMTLIGSAAVISAAVLLGLDGYSPRMVYDAPLLSWVLGVAGIALWIFAWPDDET
ncbi:ubiquinone biosynthesis regulatory protein kinase UbiB [Solemya pervernicosa gill symbiont]|uniref:Probable protein kinase UbiB n=3 Tax=Gammaproteobacteria incertae sedis TaxID=118884 RepID=A0A1T2L3G7_9GAMM|nr:ubiquinone biosynthesis regulatory protein kinase UbiB [Solemya pervernicosa gill symbiont]QKQ28130.1 ubiquinone biosynthesis regulatory protein kinase UbiB [Candidatus Reidiella endopervernicosa]